MGGRTDRTLAGNRRLRSRGRGSSGRSPTSVCVPAERDDRAGRSRMVRCATRITSLPSLPRICSAPQSGLSSAICRIRATVSARSGGRPGRGRDLRRYSARKPARCHCCSVSGHTMSSAGPGADATGGRSARVTAGRVTLRRRTSSCWRSKAFSARSCVRLRSRSSVVPAACVPAAGRAHRQARRTHRTPATRSVNRRPPARTPPQLSPSLRASILSRQSRASRA